MKKSLTVTFSSIAAFFAINTAANAQETEASQQDVNSPDVVSTNQSNLGAYIVKAGDCLYNIALDHGITLDQLYALNPGIQPLIFPGDKIVVSENAATAQYHVTSTESNETPVSQASFESTATDESGVTYENYETPINVSQTSYDGLKGISNAGNLYTDGQCTYYAFNRRAELGKPIGSLWGNASNWAASASQAGFNVNNTPEVGAIFQSGPGQNGAGAYGHVGVVESVNPNGTLTVSEMNWNGGVNVKSYRTIYNPGSYSYIH
ncbi:CHAP domain protein [Staphylococcus caprae M23864:W1]|uniref:LysM domain-containing protein n=1 Tax=Staphylococcus caprae TaxID=29380 RepID=A0ABM7FYE8_9STAP|nr:CHAP domain-containing protein [Staphylococcus caprae]EES40917.1 CHAP domain protein [Staphylococcus caprae M23864:W1]MBX5322203.1 CHAP domain-containing protein [Staphylococcus caprae]MDI0015064.1 CHAP domain-containing protein [Staphylococcus caprae]MEB8093792.1 CHAP domain-containing protein [Staphylococcus caprae]PAK64991.1 peptidase M23 [Staphylococcus caprae]